MSSCTADEDFPPQSTNAGTPLVKEESLGDGGRDHYQVMPVKGAQGAAVTGGVSREFPRESPPVGAVGSL